MDLALFFQIYMYKKSVFICRIYHFQNCSHKIDQKNKGDIIIHNPTLKTTHFDSKHTFHIGLHAPGRNTQTHARIDNLSRFYSGIVKHFD